MSNYVIRKIKCQSRKQFKRRSGGERKECPSCGMMFNGLPHQELCQACRSFQQEISEMPVQDDDTLH